MATRPTITAARIKTLRATNHVVAAFPRKGTVRVDGAKMFTISKRELAKLLKR